MHLNRIRLALLIALAATFIFTSVALAHALLLRSVPAANASLIEPPATLELWFSEPLETDFSSTRLLTSAGDEILPQTVAIDPNDLTHLTAVLGVRLPPGNYTVAWKTLSRADGHDYYGNFPFTVLNADGSRPAGVASTGEAGMGSELPTPAQTISRWLALLGGLLFLSAPLFLTFVLAGVLAPGANNGLETRLNLLGLKISAVAVLAIVLGSWLQIATQATGLTNPALLPRLIYGTHTAVLALARQTLGICGLLLVLATIRSRVFNRSVLILLGAYAICLCGLNVVAGFQGEGLLALLTLLPAVALLALAWFAQRTQPPAMRELWKILLALGSLILLSFSLGSHAEAAPGRFWAVLFDFIHLLASSAWLGGLMLLPFMLEQIIPRANPAPDFSPLRPLFRRYGYLAKFSFFLLLVTGVFNSLVHFPTFASLITTPYGRVLLAKVALMIAIWWLSLKASRIFRQKPDPTQMANNLQKFNRQISQAALIGLGLMASVAILVQTQPPTSQPPSSSSIDSAYHNSIKADDLLAHIYISPAQPGNNQFEVSLSHQDDSSIGSVQLVRLLFDQEGVEVGQASMVLDENGPNIFGGTGVYLNRPGKWKLSLYVRRRGMDDTLAEIGLLNLSAPVSPPEAPFQNPVATIPVNGLLSGGLLVAGAEILRWRRTIQQVRHQDFRLWLTLSGALILSGIILGALQISQLIAG